MGPSAGAGAVLLCVLLSVVAAASAEAEPHFISIAALTATEPSGRKLIGFPPGFCPVQFDEKQQIAKIANACRGQEVPLPSCCAAFRDVACPYYGLLDEVTNGCSVELLMKIHDQCMLPAEYFAMCGDSDVGMSCPANS